MLELKFVKENKETVQEASKNKGINIDIDHVLNLEKTYRELLLKTEDLRRERNQLTESNKGKKPSTEDVKKGKELRDSISTSEVELTKARDIFMAEFKKIPNIPSHDVPVGTSEDENVIIKEVGEKRVFNFPIKTHWQIAQAKGWIDKERAANVAGARFAYHIGDFVRLEWALQRFVMDELTDEKFLAKIIKEKGLNLSSTPFVPILPPLLIKTGPYDAMDRLEPRDERYKIEGEDLWLQGSAEHVLGSMFINEIIPEKDLPIRFLGFATSFRKEAGAAGKDVEGIMRMHQFNKLEMQSFTTPETSFDEHHLMVALQEHIMQKLGIPYRLIMKCTFDIGKPNARGVDIDSWMPGQGKYRETNSADYMTDFQARRLNTRVRKNNGELEFVHTNDATALAQRPLIAILENYQEEDGSVTIPEALKSYMKNVDKI